MSYFPPTGSTVAFQTDATKLAANVSVTGGFVNVLGSIASAPFPGSVSGVGLFNVNHTGNGSIQTVSLGSIATAPFPASVSGVGVFNVNHIGAGSIIAILNNSSVAALQGTTPWIVGNSSVQVVGVMPAVSIVGGFIRTEDNAHATGDVGLFVLAVRNDTVASFTSASGDYSPRAVDAAGRTLVKPYAPDQATFQVTASTVNIQSTSLVAAGNAGLKTYITDIEASNTGSVTTLLTLRDGDNSVMGKLVLPAGGGNNPPVIVPYQTNGFAQQTHFEVNVASSIVHVAARGYYAP